MYKINITFVLIDQSRISVQALEGESILEVAKKFNIPIRGVCGGALSCATCNVHFDLDVYNKIDSLSKIEEEENDALDNASNITYTSRLSCQVFLTKEMEGLVIYLL